MYDNLNCQVVKRGASSGSIINNAINRDPKKTIHMVGRMSFRNNVKLEENLCIDQCFFIFLFYSFGDQDTDLIEK